MSSPRTQNSTHTYFTLFYNALQWKLRFSRLIVTMKYGKLKNKDSLLHARTNICATLSHVTRDARNKYSFTFMLSKQFFGIFLVYCIFQYIWSLLRYILLVYFIIFGGLIKTRLRHYVYLINVVRLLTHYFNFF